MTAMEWVHGGHKTGHRIEGTELRVLEVAGAKGGTRTPMGFPARS